MATGNQPTDSGSTAQVVSTAPAYRIGSAPPLDPIQQVVSYESLSPRTITLNGVTAEPVVDANVNRVAFMVEAVGLRDFYLTASSDATAGPMPGFGSARTPQVIHSAVYPLLCQNAWYAVGDAGVVLRIWEILKAG